VKSDLARNLVADFHSKEEADRAAEEFKRRFVERQAPAGVETVPIKPAAQRIRLVDLLVEVDLAPSKAEARRLISQGGVKINGEKIGEISFEIDTNHVREAQLQVGKLRFLRVEFEMVAGG
jgi:tyrosyl-tRNA synthetase